MVDNAQYGWTALMMGTNQNHTLVAQRLIIAAHADVNIQKQVNFVMTVRDTLFRQDGWTALMIAVEKNNTSIVESLIAAHADVNIKNEVAMVLPLIITFVEWIYGTDACLYCQKQRLGRNTSSSRDMR